MANLQASIGIDPATPIEAIDRAVEGYSFRIVVLKVDKSLELSLSHYRGDAAVVETIDHLIEPLQSLRSAALRRLAETPSREPVPA